MALITFQVGIKLFLRLPALLDFSWLDFIFLTKASQWSGPIVMLFAQIWRSKGKKLNHNRWQTDRGTAHDSGPWDRKTGRLGDVGTLEKKLVVASVVPRLPGRKTLVAAGHVTTCDSNFSTEAESTNSFLSTTATQGLCFVCKRWPMTDSRVAASRTWEKTCVGWP